jgi:hypothetical protein
MRFIDAIEAIGRIKRQHDLHAPLKAGREGASAKLIGIKAWRDPRLTGLKPG